MLKSYLLSTYRNVLKYKSFFLFNITGLSIAISCVLLILIYVFSEFTYESHNSNADLIYRIGVTTEIDDNIVEFAANVPALAPALADEFPEISNYVRIKRDFNNIKVKQKETAIYVEDIYTVDTSFFSVFSYKFIRGNSDLFKKSYSVVLSKKIATSLFGTDDAIGKNITIGNLNFIVSGVLDTPPTKSHLKFDILVPWSALPPDEDWEDAHAYTYLLLNKNSDFNHLKKKIQTFVNESEDVQALEDKLSGVVRMDLQPLKDIHLGSSRHNELSQNGNPVLLYIFISVAIFFLLLSCISYVNMAIASSLIRAKEIGVRKVIGAVSSQIRSQYLFESFITILFAFTIGSIITVIFLNYFANLIDEKLDYIVLINPWFCLVLLLFITGHTLLSGVYPAFYISSFDPAKTLRFQSSTGGERSLSLRKVLLVLQLTISATVVTATFIVLAQLNYIKNVDLGFNKENVVIINLPSVKNSDYFLQTLSKQTFVKQVALSDYFPGISYKDEYLVETKEGDMKTRALQRMFVDHSFIDLLNMSIISGRNFKLSFKTDLNEAIIVNETAVKTFGWSDPIGRKVESINSIKKGVIVGVVKDANLFSLHKKVEPIVIHLTSRNLSDANVVYVKFKTTIKDEDILQLKELYRSTFGEEFQFTFLDDRYEKLYKSDEKLGYVLLISSIIILVISTAGLFSLSNFIALQRSKEMVIRKIMGASTWQILLLYIRNFTILTIIANIVAWPLAYFMMSKWLENFTFHIGIGVTFHLFAFIVTLITVEITIGIHAFRLARLNPINIIKA